MENHNAEVHFDPTYFLCLPEREGPVTLAFAKDKIYSFCGGWKWPEIIFILKFSDMKFIQNAVGSLV